MKGSLIEIEKPILPIIPINWDYNESIEKVKINIYKWKTLDNDIAHELWIAREKLSKVGRNWNNSSNKKTWSDYCIEIGSSRQVVNHWLKEWYEIKNKQIEEKIRKQREEILSGLEQPNGLYDMIIIDPPWNYGRKYDSEGSRSASPYPEMTQEQLLQEDISSKTKNDCILWLWTTDEFIWDAKELLEHWGFEYKAILTWDKEKMGMGRWLRLQCEYCLLGIKGKPLWESKDIRDIIRESRTQHSVKPESFYKILKDNFIGRKLDYFGREPKEGFDSYGTRN